MPATTAPTDLDDFVEWYRANGAPKAAKSGDDDDIDSFTQKFYASQQSKLKTPIPFASPIPGRSLSDSAAKLGQPLTTLTPPPQDTSTTPINVFSGEAQAPGMRTQEETAKLGTIGPAQIR